MDYDVFAVRDSKIEGFLPPFTAVNPAVASRLLEDSLRGDNPMSRHPEDYSLYRIGLFDDESGLIEGRSPQLICTVDSLLDSGQSLPLFPDGQDEASLSETGTISPGR